VKTRYWTATVDGVTRLRISPEPVSADDIRAYYGHLHASVTKVHPFDIDKYDSGDFELRLHHSIRRK
jgi:hypothetical protein